MTKKKRQLFNKDFDTHLKQKKFQHNFDIYRIAYTLLNNFSHRIKKRAEIYYLNYFRFHHVYISHVSTVQHYNTCKSTPYTLFFLEEERLF